MIWASHPLWAFVFVTVKWGWWKQYQPHEAAVRIKWDDSKHFTYTVRAYTGVCWQHSCYYGPDGITILDWCFKLLEISVFQSSLFCYFCVFLFGGCWEAGRWYLGCFFFFFFPILTYQNLFFCILDLSDYPEVCCSLSFW